jgi:hypothetical protein
MFLSACGISAVGTVDADALPASEKPSPAAPSTLTAAVLLVRFGVEACLIRGMIASSKMKVLDCPERASTERSAQELPQPKTQNIS